MTEAMADPITIQYDGALATLTVASPPVNLLDAAMTEALDQALTQLESATPRGLLLRAEGRVWTGGVDVETFARTPDGAAGGELWARLLGFTQRLEALPCPTVFSAHALCLTWGFELAVACDLIVAAPKAKFGLVEKVVGLTPSMGGTQRLAARAGTARAKEFVMTGDLYSAKTLYDWGVVNRIFEPEELDAEAAKLARSLAEGPTLAHNATKILLASQADGGVQAADALVASVCGELFDTEDLKGAVRSFLDDGPGNATFHGK